MAVLHTEVNDGNHHEKTTLPTGMATSHLTTSSVAEGFPDTIPLSSLIEYFAVGVFGTAGPSASTVLSVDANDEKFCALMTSRAAEQDPA